MKKNLLCFIVVLFICTLLTGCVKYDVTMEIKKDKSMNFSILYAFDMSLLKEEDISNLFTEENKKELNDSGFVLLDYSNDKMKGYKIEKKIENIDEVSSTTYSKYSLLGLLDKEEINKPIFKIEKGLFKNKYTAILDFKVNDNLMVNNKDEDSNTITNCLPDDENTNCSDIEEEKIDDQIYFTELKDNVDMNFVVKLPYSAISSNAPIKKDDNKSLYWNLVEEDLDKINFSFNLYNMRNIYITISGGIFLLVILVIMFKGGKKQKAVFQGNTSNDIVLEQQDISSDNSSATVPENQIVQPAANNSIELK